jgi:hypothetical protein
MSEVKSRIVVQNCGTCTMKSGSSYGRISEASGEEPSRHSRWELKLVVLSKISILPRSRRNVGGVDKPISKSRDETWGYFVPDPILARCKHQCAVSRVFDGNLTVCSGRICGSPKAIELCWGGKKERPFSIVIKGSETRRMHKDSVAGSASNKNK